MSQSVLNRAAAAALSLFVLSSSSSATAGEVRESFIAEGVTAKIGGYRPIRAEMDQDESIVSKMPEGLESPKFGYLEFGENKWAFILSEPEEGEAKLWIDSNGDGDLTNDPETDWKPREQGELTTYSGGGKIELNKEKTGAIRAYRFDPSDKRRASLANTLMYYGDFGSEYAFDLDGKEYTTFVAGSLSSSGRLPIDRDGNKRISSRLENVTIGTPFNFTGTSYVFSVDAGKLKLEEASDPVDMTPLPPDVSVGKQALTFEAKTIDDAEIQFPSSFAGKIVMLDFWATWCGPCIGEVPHMKEAYTQWHDQGFEILGVSFDNEDEMERVQKFLEDKEIS
ncbi:MAG: TlpA family protein disulfide reductase, partial [Planctomycetaceae bacterium]|nr:TlpA family protein disulfide reductase [Planctomycetaceae bacterium]